VNAPRTPLARFRPLVAGAAVAVAVAVASSAAITADITWASNGAPARAAVDVVTILVAALTAFLLGSGGAGSGAGRDRTLAFGVALLGVAEATCSLLPEVVSFVHESTIESIDTVASLLVAVVFAVAALAPAGMGAPAGRRSGWAMVGALAALPTVALLTVVADRAHVEATSTPGWQPVVYLAAALLAVPAGCAFAVRAFQQGAELQSWVAAAIVVLGAANLDEAVNQVVTADSLTTADLLHAGVVVILLAGVVRQLGAHRSSATHRGITEERRRIARDLHDGLSQELAYIAAQAPHFAAATDDPVAARLAEAAACALDESRLAISSLSEEPSEPLGPALIRTAERIAARSGAVVCGDIDDGVDVACDVRLDLLRIVREATTNAVHHGGASQVSILLQGEPHVMLRIGDNGGGFDAARAAPGWTSGFGLTSMRQRAERAGGRLEVRSDPAGGTVVEVHLR